MVIPVIGLYVNGWDIFGLIVVAIYVGVAVTILLMFIRLANRQIKSDRTYCDWEPGRLLIEPGISDVDHGRWSRREFHCRRCRAVRRMWQLVDTSTVLEQCPSKEA